MKLTFIALLALCLCVAGCGKKEVKQTAKESPKINKAPEKSKPKPPSVKPGTLLWEFETEDDVYSSPAIGSDGTVYVGSDKKVYALDGNTGAKKWEFETGGFVDSSPAISSDGTVYVGSAFPKPKVYALDGKSGAKKWEYEMGVRVESSPAIGSDGTVYIGSDKVYALRSASKGLAKSPWPMRGQNAQHTGRALKK